ncbi:MAG: CmcI family methyltransferase [Vicingaceae bacterium]
MQPNQSLINQKAWKKVIQREVLNLKAKVKSQVRVPTFYDKKIMRALNEINSLQEDSTLAEQIDKLSTDKQSATREHISIIEAFIEQKGSQRYVTHHSRFLSDSKKNKSVADSNVLNQSQGIHQALSWKGLPLMKSTFDYSIYSQLLWNVKPKTIIELGSGSGASAIWMADLLNLYKIDNHIYSIDINKVEQEYNGVSFLQADLKNISECLPQTQLKKKPHPWLVIHDAHVHHEYLMDYFVPYFEVNDYFVVEDSVNFQKEIAQFLMAKNNPLLIDTFYTDFFGRNMTTATNSILTKVQNRSK